jgi:DNA-binding MarR family transcriptional regulator
MRKSTSEKPRSQRKVGVEDYRRLAEFRFAIRSFLDFSQQAARAAGLTAQQHQALLTIKSLSTSGNVSIAALAERLLKRHHSAVELVNRLVDLQLLQRQQDDEDRRRVHLSLTAKAERLLESLSAAHLDELQRMRPSLRAILALTDSHD